MNLDQYYNLYHYLDTDQFPDGLTDQEQKRLMTQAKYFETRHHLLYKKNRRNPDRPLRVIKWTEVKPVLYMMHKHPTAGHWERMPWIIKYQTVIIGIKCIMIYKNM